MHQRHVAVIRSMLLHVRTWLRAHAVALCKAIFRIPPIVDSAGTGVYHVSKQYVLNFISWPLCLVVPIFHPMARNRFLQLTFALGSGHLTHETSLTYCCKL